MIAIGAWAALSGFRHLQEPGIDLGPHATYRYAMSKQWADISCAIAV
jgi:hypothetical protein